MIDVFKELRPQILHLIQHKKIESYINQYVAINGHEPVQKLINEYINILIANDSIIKEYDRLISAFEDHVFNNRISNTRKMAAWIFSDSTLMTLILAVCIQLILIYISKKMEHPLFDANSLINETSFISAIILLIISFGHIRLKK